MSIWVVVEDEPDISDVLLAMFEIWGVDARAFPDGASAIAWIDSVDGGTEEQLPSLAVLDIRLPDMNGTVVAARIRQSPRLRNMGVVMITAYRLSPAKEQAILQESGADLLLYKPLPMMGELRERLESVLRE